MSQRFAPEVHTFIRDNVVGHTAKELAAMTNERFGTDFTPLRMKNYKQNHKLKSGTPKGVAKGTPSQIFPQNIVDYIYQNHKGIGPKGMTQLLNEQFAADYTRSQVAAFYKNHRLDSGLTGRFEKGHEPVNKGMKGICYPGCEKGHFKRGHDPHNKTPIGTVRKKTDGYLWKKIGEGCREWKQLHIIIWEEAGRSIPESHHLIFKDGNKQNCTLENLMLVSRAENAIMNKCGLRFSTPEHTETGNIIAKIKIAQKNRRKNNAK